MKKVKHLNIGRNYLHPDSARVLAETKTLSNIEYIHKQPSENPHLINIKDEDGKNYRWNRNFRFAIPNLRFGSGVRFELKNYFNGNKTNWQVDFYYGNSKNIIKQNINNNVIIYVCNYLINLIMYVLNY